MLAGFAAAYMSTVGTHLNWGASYLVGDVYKRFLRKGASEKHYVAVSRWTTVGLFLASIVVTLNLSSIEGAWRFLLALGSGTGLVLILRWYWWRINAWSEISAMVDVDGRLARAPSRSCPTRRPAPAPTFEQQAIVMLVTVVVDDRRLGRRHVPDGARARRDARRVLPARAAGRAGLGARLRAPRLRTRADPGRRDVLPELGASGSSSSTRRSSASGRSSSGGSRSGFALLAVAVAAFVLIMGSLKRQEKTRVPGEA